MLLGPMLKILFIESEYKDDNQLKINEEFRRIQQVVKRAQPDGEVELLPLLAARIEELSEALLRHRPHIVHLSLHGDPRSKSLLFIASDARKEDRKQAREQHLEASSTPQGVREVTPDELAAMFRPVADTVRCVLLNACWSQAAAQALASAKLPYIIGTTRKIPNSAALQFSEAF